jgi:hypothetical protein
MGIDSNILLEHALDIVASQFSTKWRRKSRELIDFHDGTGPARFFPPNISHSAATILAIDKTSNVAGRGLRAKLIHRGLRKESPRHGSTICCIEYKNA